MFRFINGQLYFEHRAYTDIPGEQANIVHINYFHQIIYIVRGSVNVTIESAELKMKEGDIILIPAGKYHSAKVTNSRPYERYVLKFTDRFMPDHVREKLNAGDWFFANSRKFESVFRLFDEYAEEYSPKELHAIFAAELIKLVTISTINARPPKRETKRL